MTKAEATEKLINRLRKFHNSPYAAKPIVTKERLQEEFLRTRAGIIDGLRNRWWMKFFAWAVAWKKIDLALDEGIKQLIADTGDGLIKEWQLAAKTKNLSDEELSEKVVAAVIEVFGSLTAYGRYGRNLAVCCDMKLAPLLEKTINRDSLVETLFLQRLFRRVIAEMRNVGQKIFEMSIALR